MVQHHKPNREYVQKTRQNMGSGSWWTPQKGEKNQFRVLPAWDDRGVCIVKRTLHYGFEVDGRNRAYPCLEQNQPWLLKSPCPVCHVIAKMSKGDKDEKEAAEDLGAGSPRFVVQLVDCKHPEKGRLFWGGPLSFGKYFTSLLEDDDVDDITDPEAGYDIIMEISGSGRGAKYDYRLRPKSSPIPFPGWADELEDLIKMIEVKDEDGLIEQLKENYGNAFDIDNYLSDFETRKVSKEKEKEPDKPKAEKQKVRVTASEVNDMSKRDLRGLVKEYNLDIKGEDWEGIKELRELVIKKLGLSESSAKKSEGESEYTIAEIKEMTQRALLDLVEKENLPIDDDDWNTIDEFRELVIEELGVEVPF